MNARGARKIRNFRRRRALLAATRSAINAGGLYSPKGRPNVRDLIHNCMKQMSWLPWVGTAIVLCAGVTFVLARGRRTQRTNDLGVISDQWIAQHRATSHDPSR